MLMGLEASLYVSDEVKTRDTINHIVYVEIL